MAEREKTYAHGVIFAGKCVRAHTMEERTQWITTTTRSNATNSQKAAMPDCSAWLDDGSLGPSNP